jgi:hypothetical protein
MSFATDMHPFWLTRTVYEELADLDTRLQRFLPYYDLIFGPRRLVINTAYPPCDLQQITVGGWGGPPVVTEAPVFPEELKNTLPDWNYNRKVVRGKVPLFYVRKAMNYMAELRVWLQDVSSSAAGPLTQRGAMMGDPTSFPVMPLMSAYSAEIAGHNPKDGMLTGDDAAFSGFGRHKIKPYEEAMQSLGGVISQSKTEWHLKKAMFCERPYYEGRPQPFFFLSTWVAPPGGSKGEINWITQSLTAVQQNVDNARPKTAGLWIHSPHWRSQQAAFLMGLPIGAAPEFGGALHPKFPRVSLKWHRQWLGYLTTMPLAELVSGSKLGIFPSPYQHVRRVAADHVVQELVDGNKFSCLLNQLAADEIAATGSTEIDVPPVLHTSEGITAEGVLNRVLDSVCDEAASPLIKADLYYRPPIEPGRTPSIRKACRSFHRKVSKGRMPWAGDYDSVAKEVRRRKSIYVSRAYRLKPIVSTYGLENSKPLHRVRQAHWVEGRVAFR